MTRFRRTLTDNLTAAGFLAPAGVVLLIFWILPVILAFYLSFTNFEAGDKLFGAQDTVVTMLGDTYEGTLVEENDTEVIIETRNGTESIPANRVRNVERRFHWIGAANYKQLFNAKDGDREVFTKTFWNTVNYVLWSVPLTMAIALAMAMLLNNKLKGIGIFRTIFFLPHITTWVAIAIVFKFIFNPSRGLANFFLREVVGTGNLGWLNEPRGVVEMVLGTLGIHFDFALHPLIAGPSLAMMAIIITSVWYDVGFFVIIFLAGLQNIDRSNYEAADIDGATGWQKFRFITVPLLGPVVFFLLVISMINAFKVFIPMFIMTPQGGPDRTTQTMVFFLYNKAFTSGKLGYGAAIAFVLLAIILTATLIQRFVIGRKVHYD